MKTLDLNQFDFTGLESQISKKLHYNVKFDSAVVKIYNGRMILELKSRQDYKDEAGIMTGIYKSLRLASFVSGHAPDDTYMVAIHFTYEYITGGSNGAELCSAWYNFITREWIVKFNY